MSSTAAPVDLQRIRESLALAGGILRRFRENGAEVGRKASGELVTEADLAADEALREFLSSDGYGWLSEETADSEDRLHQSRVWVVDPLDGTKEFVQGVPEWAVSVGLVEDGQPIAGGIYNPVSDQMIVGAVGQGVFLNGEPAGPLPADRLDDTVVLASRSEVKRGEWDRFQNDVFEVRPMGSVAYKLGLVAAGLADATWTLVPKSEWDVAAGVALLRASGGRTQLPGGEQYVFNQPRPKLPGLIASGAALMPAIERRLA